MAKYINATGNGRRQIEALVGPTIHNNAGATTDDPVVSLTFSCFGESVGLFGGEDALWTDVMAGNANRISKAGGVMLDDDNSTLGLVAATILFYQARILPYVQGPPFSWALSIDTALRGAPSAPTTGCPKVP